MSINISINDNNIFETTMERIDAARVLIEYSHTLMRDILEGYLNNLHWGRYDTKILVEIEGKYAISKAEMVERFLNELDIELDAVVGLLHEPRAAAAAAEQTQTPDEENHIATGSKEAIKDD